MDRRRFLAACAAAGLSPALLPDLLRAQDEKQLRIGKEILAEAEKLIGLSFTDAERELMLDGLDEALDGYARLRAVPLANAVPPACGFKPLRGGEAHADGAGAEKPTRSRWSKTAAPVAPDDLEELAFCPVTELAALLRTRKISSRELTQMYLARLQRFDPALLCVVTLFEERALAAAQRADAELSRGRHRGPLHGVPYGLKDLIAVRGARTTWGARPYREQVVDEDATVVHRTEEAGAILLAKLSCGALAWGDVWFGGKTRNPWKLDQGSSGSSAGSAAATAAGLVGFAIGTETYGSIVSPSTRCGATGLRPTFGRISRHGCMALAWSLDKIGPITRAVEDGALVLDAVHGADGLDPDAVTAPFAFDAKLDVRKLRVGYLAGAFSEERDDKAFDDDMLDVLRELGVQLRPVSLPDSPAADMISVILTAEAGAAFDAFSRGNLDDQLVRQNADAWPNVFRQSRLIPAVEYVMANRIRTQTLRGMARLMQEVDVIVSPTFGGTTLALTNLTGHPEVVVPAGFREDGTPVSVTFVGGLFDEGPALALARAYQDATGFQRRMPPLFGPGSPTPALPEIHEPKTDE